MHVHTCSSEPCAQDLFERHDCMQLTCAHWKTFVSQKFLSEHKLAAQKWDSTLAGYTFQLAMKTLLTIITTGGDNCSHDAEEVLSTRLKTAGMYVHLLALTPTQSLQLQHAPDCRL